MKIKRNMFVLIEACDFEKTPIGGQLSFCKQLIEIYGDQLVLIGVNSAKEPVGRWFKKNISEQSFQCFNLYNSSSKKKPIVPLRIQTMVYLFKYRNKIFRETSNLPFFVNSPETMIALTFFRQVKEKYWYIFHGVENPLAMPRYVWGKLFAQLFEYLLFKSLRHADRILACADKRAISSLLAKIKKTQLKTDIIQFSTRYDDNCFYPDRSTLQHLITKHNNVKKLVVTGRINEVKGWPFILQMIKAYIRLYSNPNVEVVFVGDGEDRHKLESTSKAIGIDNYVKVTGFLTKDKVRKHYQDCDLVLVGSHKEGWSISMLEALACGKSIVTTDVSGASDMIESGVNGFICMERNPELFAKMVNRALRQFPFINEFSIDVASKYKLSNMKHSLDDALNLN